MSDIIDGTVYLNPLEINNIIKTKYKVPLNASEEVKKSETEIDNFKKQYDVDKEMQTKETAESFQKKYSYNLNKMNKENITIKKNIIGVALRNKRLGYVRDAILAKNSNDIKKFKELCNSYVDTLFMESVNDIRNWIEFYKIQPIFMLSCVNYFYDLYKRIEKEMINLEFKPKVNQIKDKYIEDLDILTKSSQNLVGKTSDEIKNIIASKKAILDRNFELEKTKIARELAIKEQERKRNNKSSISYNEAIDLMGKLDVFFEKTKSDASILSADPSILASLFTLEKDYFEVRGFLHNLNDQIIQKYIDSKSRLEIDLKKISRYYSSDRDDLVIKHRKEVILKDLKDKLISGFYSGEIKSGLLVMDDNLEVINELLIFAGYEKTEDKEKTRSS